MRRETADPTPLQDIQKHAAELQRTISDQVNALVTSDNTQAINKALKDGTDSFLQQLSAFSSSLQSAATDANEKTKAVVEQTRQSLQQKGEEGRQQ
ncbi:hypothetical protein, partial [Klebsiella pneumoniae]|uniref:hypothetical protein n=1 Tax=Klebsiella pneumoniae TaxID=573 RepID=UPI001330A1BC